MKNLKEIKQDLAREEQIEILRDFQKCSDVVLRLASMYPEDVNSWKGTVSERLSYLVNKLIEERKQ